METNKYAALVSSLCSQVNREIVKIQRVLAPVGQMQLKNLIEAHVVRPPYLKLHEIYACLQQLGS